jgi:hypothetical protein
LRPRNSDKPTKITYRHFSAIHNTPKTADYTGESSCSLQLCICLLLFILRYHEIIPIHLSNRRPSSQNVYLRRTCSKCVEKCSPKNKPSLQSDSTINTLALRVFPAQNACSEHIMDRSICPQQFSSPKLQAGFQLHSLPGRLNCNNLTLYIVCAGARGSVVG